MRNNHEKAQSNALILKDDEYLRPRNTLARDTLARAARASHAAADATEDPSLKMKLGTRLKLEILGDTLLTTYTRAYPQASVSRTPHRRANRPSVSCRRAYSSSFSDARP